MSDSSSNTKASSGDRRTFLKIGAGVVGGLVVGGAVAYVAKGSTTTTSTAYETQTSTLPAVTSTATSTVTSTAPPVTSTSTATSTVTSTSPPVTSTVTSTTTSTNTSEIVSLQTQLQNVYAFQTLGTSEVALVKAIAATIIPTDSNGPGATEAGVVYFIDAQLASKYGSSGHMYMQGPYIQHDLKTPVTIKGTTFSAGTMATVPDSGMRYQYNMDLRFFWKQGLVALETYANAKYGGNFETLSAANPLLCLQDLANNVPTYGTNSAQFGEILPSDFFYELYFMTFCGFLMDPMYGGNQGMVGWLLTAFNGTNQGNFYGEGHTTHDLMLATTPTALKPASLGQFQAAANS